LQAHGGYTQNKPNGYCNPITGETNNFSEDNYEPCKIIELYEPIRKEEKINPGDTSVKNENRESKVDEINTNVVERTLPNEHTVSKHGQHYYIKGEKVWKKKGIV